MLRNRCAERQTETNYEYEQLRRTSQEQISQTALCDAECSGFISSHSRPQVIRSERLQCFSARFSSPSLRLTVWLTDWLRLLPVIIRPVISRWELPFRKRRARRFGSTRHLQLKQGCIARLHFRRSPLKIRWMITPLKIPTETKRKALIAQRDTFSIHGLLYYNCLLLFQVSFQVVFCIALVFTSRSVSSKLASKKKEKNFTV